MRAFILGNSGELLDHDLSKLKGEVVFDTNCLPLRAASILTHYVCLDVLMAFVPEIRSLVPKGCVKYYSRFMWNGVHKEDGEVRVFDVYDDRLIGFEFSDTRLYGGKTVTYAALQIAAYLGYDPIYLLGVDLGYPANGKLHIPEQEVMMQMVREKNLANPTVDKRGNNPNHDEMRKVTGRMFSFAKNELDAHGVTVVNLSRGGNLNCFPRENFEEVLLGVA